MTKPSKPATPVPYDRGRMRLQQEFSPKGLHPTSPDGVSRKVFPRAARHVAKNL